MTKIKAAGAFGDHGTRKRRSAGVFADTPGWVREGGLFVPDGGSFDPLSIAWHAAYWVEGAEFAALGVADGATVQTWPDEVGTRDIAQATSTKRPTYRASSAGLGDRPILEFDGTADALAIASASFGTPAQPNEVFLVARVRTSSGEQFIFDAGPSADSNRHLLERTSGGAWGMAAGGSVVSGGVVGTTKHAVRVVYNGASSAIVVDGSTVASGNPGSGGLAGLTVGALSGAGVLFAAVDVAFLGVSDTLLSTEDRDALLAWSRAYYGTP